MQPIKILAITGLLLLLAAGCAHVPAPSVSLEPSLGEAKIFDYHGVRINYYEIRAGAARSSSCMASGAPPIPGGFWPRSWPGITGF